MCQFEVTALYCGCQDKFCKQKVTELGESEFTHVGHILKVMHVFRSTNKPLCMGTFVNKDRDRLLVRNGMDPTNGNSTQDCTKAVWIIMPDRDLYMDTCRECQQRCNWQTPPPSETGE